MTTPRFPHPVWLLFLIVSCLGLVPDLRGARAVPTPLEGHPGNIFAAGEEVTLPVSPDAGSWRLSDYHAKPLAQIDAQDGRVSLGRLPVGFYRLDSPGASNWISLGVLARLHAPVPATSPLGIDVAMAWFYKEEQMDAVASLCALAGMNRVRDRLTWAEMEPHKGQFAGPNRYDASARAQSRAGLRVLQVIHLSPTWANPAVKRFPVDLRDAYRFYEAMAKRWQGQLEAFEPWNEADIPMFGGHTGSEMATLQKAAYLGLKAGNPSLVACLNVFALHNRAQLEDLQANETWAYFDTFNLHHYAPFDEYPTLYAEFRAVSAGKPLWVSECSVPVHWAGDPTRKEPVDGDQKVQSERVAKTFACSLHQGSAATFYFLLPHYVEGQTQFGILRPDLTPRPAYVALAAAGRLLAAAKPLGQLSSPNPAVRAFLFDAEPDGHRRHVLVAWTTQSVAVLPLPIPPLASFDHLGRERPGVQELVLSSAPSFVVLPSTAADHLSLIAPPPPPPLRAGTPSTVVLQAIWPEDRIDLNRSAYRLAAGTPHTIPIFAYNFGSKAVRVKLHVTAPIGWEASLPGTVELEPQDRKELSLLIRDSALTAPAKVQVRAEFEGGRPATLSLPIMR